MFVINLFAKRYLYVLEHVVHNTKHLFLRVNPQTLNSKKSIICFRLPPKKKIKWCLFEQHKTVITMTVLIKKF